MPESFNEFNDKNKGKAEAAGDSREKLPLKERRKGGKEQRREGASQA